MTYQIRNWEQHFENHDTRKLRHLYWVPLPVKHDGKGYRQVMRAGPEIYAAWIVLVQIAAKCPERGVLADTDGPLSFEDVSIKTDVPLETLEKAVPILIRVGWLEKTGESPGVSGDSPGIARLQDRTGNYIPSAKKPAEGQTGTNNAPANEPTKAEPKPATAKANGANVWAEWVELHRKRGRPDPLADGADVAAAKRISKALPDETERTALLRRYMDDDDRLLRDSGHALRHFAGRMNRYRAERDKAKRIAEEAARTMFPQTETPPDAEAFNVDEALERI
jgi:hypothetical protein